jgi:CDP-2,3-bis-(O-geranylgeranyl)-sn-glycerol synthase
MIETIIIAIWLMIPAYMSNPFAALLGGGTPIDLGKVLSDKRRILGDGKTYQGLFGGIVCGILIGIIQLLLLKSNLDIFYNLPLFGQDLIDSFVIIISLSIGALLGDLIASFLKRRIGLKRGSSLPVIDQLDFVFGALILTYLTSPLWFLGHFTVNIIIAILIITPILHLTANIVGYLTGVKKEPW